jgi:Fe-S cluster assembly iron-binding protein IscA
MAKGDTMLQVTDRAATVLKQARSRQGVPDNFGLRVKPPVSDESGIQFEFTAGPATDDEVGETSGLRLFVAPEVADPLAEQVIDARNSPSGSSLVLRDQSDVQ